MSLLGTFVSNLWASFLNRAPFDWLMAFDERFDPFIGGM